MSMSAGFNALTDPDRQPAGRAIKSMRWPGPPAGGNQVADGPPTHEASKVAGAHKLCSSIKAWNLAPFKSSVSSQHPPTEAESLGPRVPLRSPSSRRGTRCLEHLRTVCSSRSHHTSRSQSPSSLAEWGAWKQTTLQTSFGDRRATAMYLGAQASTVICSSLMLCLPAPAANHSWQPYWPEALAAEASTWYMLVENIWLWGLRASWIAAM